MTEPVTPAHPDLGIVYRSYAGFTDVLSDRIKWSEPGSIGPEPPRSYPLPPPGKCFYGDDYPVVAHIFDKGGTQRLLTLDGVTRITWERVQDDISKATLRIDNPSPKCQSGIERITPMRHELVLTKGDTRVWEGPIVLYKEREFIDLTAYDVLFYTKRAVLHRVYNSLGPNGQTEAVPTRLARIIAGEMARFEEREPSVNVTNGVTTIVTEDTARTSRKNLKDEKYVWDELDDMAWRNGVDYTAVGRQIYIHDTDVPLGETRPFTEADFASPPEVAIYGAELATETWVTDRQGRSASAGIGYDPYYGRVELLHGTYYESEGVEADDQTHVPIEEMQAQARRDFAPRFPMPMVVRIPENTTLSPETWAELGNQLIPGVRIPLRVQTAIRSTSMLTKLRRIRVSENEQGQRVEITLVPAPETGAVEGDEYV